MPVSRTLNKKQNSLLDMVSQGWVPYQVVQLSNYVYRVNSGSTIGRYHVVKKNEVLGLTCTHEYSEHNDHHTCLHIRAVQELLYSSPGFLTFDQEVHIRCAEKSLQATKTKKQWEWLITDIRGGAVGCMGVTVNPLNSPPVWWTTYENNAQCSWDNCNQAIEYLLAIVSF
jgi:hypothetical protein